VIPSPSNPFADANGNIHVTPGDRLPEIPEHQLKVGADYRVMPGLTIGGVLAYFGDQVLRGDESNQLGSLPGYAVVNLHGAYTVTPHVELFANLSNVLNARYATFGQLGAPTGVGAPGVPTNGVGVDNRFVSPAPPIAAFGGLRVRF
jgi:iron complex outermembrane receptor protein